MKGLGEEKLMFQPIVRLPFLASLSKNSSARGGKLGSGISKAFEAGKE